MNAIYDVIFSFWRKRRQALFLKLICPQPGDQILDVGGVPRFWSNEIWRPFNILCLNPDPNVARNSEPEGVQTILGDGCFLSEIFREKKFDIVFSNSVIEHLGTAQMQQQFAKEIRGAGKKLWVQTPAYEFPFEPHFLCPCLHWLPRPWQKTLARWLTPWGWMQRPESKDVARIVDEIRLLKQAEFRRLFPDCTILVERFLFLPKSFVAYRIQEPPLKDGLI